MRGQSCYEILKLSKGQMKHEINITKFNIMAFASNVLSFQNGFVTVTDENLGTAHFPKRC